MREHDFHLGLWNLGFGVKWVHAGIRRREKERGMRV